MAVQFGAVSLPRKNTNGSAAPSFDTYGEYEYTRLTNETLQVKIKVVLTYVGSGGYVGNGANSNIYATVSAGGVQSSALTLKAASDNWAAMSTGFSKTVEATLTVPSDTANTSITVSYSIGNGGASWVTFAKTTQSTTFSSPQLLYTKCGAPATFSINVNEARTNTEVILNWSKGEDGINNPITGYELQRSISGQNYVTVGIFNELTKTVVVSAPVGATFSFRIRSKGEIDGYESDYTSSVSCIIINTPPVISGLKVNNDKISINGGTATFSWVGTDADGEILEYFWSLEESGQQSDWVSIGNSNTITLNIGPVGEKRFLVYAKDTSGDSSEIVGITLIYNKVPTIPTIIESSGGYKKTVSFSWNASTDENSDSITYNIYRSIDDNEYLYLSNIVNTSYSEDISQEYAGKKISYKISATDGIDESVLSEAYYIYRNVPPSIPKNFSITPSDLVVPTITSIAENRIKVSWDAPDSGTSAIKQYTLEQSVTNNSSNTVWVPLISVSKDTLEYEVNIEGINRGNYIKFRIKATDTLGEESGFSDSSNTIRKNEAPTLGALNMSATGTIKIWEIPSITLTWSRMITDDAGGFYELKLVNAKNISHTFDRIVADESVNEYNYEVNLSSTNEMSELLLELFGATANGIINNNYFEIVAYDGFGVPSAASVLNLNLDFRYTPVLNEDNNLYVIKKMALSGEIAVNLDSGLYSMVNSGEGIRLVFPKVTDLNTEDVGKMTYTIKVIESEKLNYFTNEDVEQYQSLVTIAANKLGTDSQGNYYYTYTVPSVNKNLIMKFAIMATDSTGLSSNTVIFPNGIEVCRVTSPEFTLDSCSWYKVDGTVVGFSVDSTLITNGGSLIDSARKITYADRRNLERNQKNKLFKLDLEYSDESNFNTFKTLSLIDLSTTENYYYSENSWPYTINKEDAELNTSTSKFVRLKLSIRDAIVGSTDYRSVYSSVIILHASAPAISGRTTGIGISNANPEGRFHVSPQRENEIAIFGNEHEGSGYTRFIINLSTGALIAGIIDPGDLDSDEMLGKEKTLMTSDRYILVDSNNNILMTKGGW